MQLKYWINQTNKIEKYMHISLDTLTSIPFFDCKKNHKEEFTYFWRKAKNELCVPISGASLVSSAGAMNQLKQRMSWLHSVPT
jgi:hypothetical protein